MRKEGGRKKGEMEIQLTGREGKKEEIKEGREKRREE